MLSSIFVNCNFVNCKLTSIKLFSFKELELTRSKVIPGAYIYISGNSNIFLIHNNNRTEIEKCYKGPFACSSLHSTDIS